jgi:hypothetical protein
MRYFQTVPYLAILCAALVAVGCTDNVKPDDESVSLQTKQATEVLPADVAFAGRADVQALRPNSTLNPFGAGKSPLDRVEGASDARFRDLLDATGLDPKKDIREVYAVKGSGEDAPVSMVIYLDYDRERLESYLDEQVAGEMERVEARDVPFYRQTGDGNAALALANEEMIVAGSTTPAVTAMLDRLAGQGRSLSQDAAAMELVRRLSSRHDAWLVAPTLSEHLDEANGSSSGKMGRIGRAVRRAGGGVSAQSDGLRGTLWLVPREGVAASDLAKLVEGAKSAARAKQQDNSDMAWLEGVSVDARGGEGVRIAGRLPNEVLSDE